MTVRIPLYKRKAIIGYALIDAADEPLVAPYRWTVTPGSYVRTNVPVDGHVLAIHRVILGLKHRDGKKVDHVNRNPLDNRRTNLRLATDAENMQNRGSRPGSSSSYRGVYWNRAARKWGARVGLNRQVYDLGLFEVEIEAARVAARFRAERMPFTVEDPALLADDVLMAA